MRKYGKYERRPEGTGEKPPKPENPLLQTYFTSLIGLLLCVTMFFGTTYAWFSSEVANTGNEIHIGMLDVELLKQVADGDDADAEPDYVSLSETVVNNGVTSNKYNLFDNRVLWEPGYTALETVKIVDKGNLAFHYDLMFTLGEEYTALAAAAEWFDVWVYHDEANQIPVVGSYADITAQDSGWTRVGSLAQVLSGKSVFRGTMDSAEVFDKEAVHTYTIALHMNGEDVETGREAELNSLMGKKIGLNVKLIAYQMGSETDDFGNGSYDDITPVADVDELQGALNAQGNALLTTNVAVTGLEQRVSMSGGTLDGNGNTLTYSGERNPVGGSVGVVTTTGGTVRNISIEGGENGRALYMETLTSDLYVSDSILSGAYSFNLNSSAETEYSLYFTNTVFESWTSYANAAESVSFTACTFNNTLRAYGDTVLTDCKFEGDKALLDLSKLEEGETVTLVNCIYKGVSIENAVLKASGGTVTIEEASLKAEAGCVLYLSAGVLKTETTVAAG